MIVDIMIVDEAECWLMLVPGAWWLMMVEDGWGWLMVVFAMVGDI